MNQSATPTAARRLIHVVNLGGIPEFARMAYKLGLDQYNGNSGVILHSIPHASRQTSENTDGTDANAPTFLEPWLHRYSSLETFVDRLATNYLKNRRNVETTSAEPNRIIHDLVLVLDRLKLKEIGEKLVKTRSDTQQEPARPPESSRGRPDRKDPQTRTNAPPGTPAISQLNDDLSTSIRETLKTLNIEDNEDVSIVLFTVADKKENDAIAAAMAALLKSDIGQAHPLRQGRNGVIANIGTVQNARQGFVALRSLVEVMKLDAVWHQRLRFSQQSLHDNGKSQILSMTADPPYVLASEAIGFELDNLILQTAGEEHEDLGPDALAAANPVAFVDPTLTNINILAPIGKQDSGAANRPTLSQYEDASKFLEDLEKWRVEPLIESENNLKLIRDIDLAIAGFKPRIPPKDTKLAQAFDAARKKVETQLNRQSNAAQTAHALVQRKLSKDAKENKDGTLETARQKFIAAEREHRQLQDEAKSAQWLWLWGMTWLVAIIVTIALWPNVRNTDPQSNPLRSIQDTFFSADDNRGFIPNLEAYVCILLFPALVSGALNWRFRTLLKKKQNEKEQLSEALANQAAQIKYAEVLARKHAVAAARLSQAYAKLKKCQPDQSSLGTRMIAELFKPIALGAHERLQADIAPETHLARKWATDLRNSVREAYVAASSNLSLHDRVAETLGSPRIQGKLPRANLEVRIDGSAVTGSLVQVHTLADDAYAVLFTSIGHPENPQGQSPQPRIATGRR